MIDDGVILFGLIIDIVIIIIIPTSASLGRASSTATTTPARIRVVRSIILGVGTTLDLACQSR
jgi:hypothetical protein